MATRRADGPWQLDIVGGGKLADGTEVKVVSGVDDHSRFCVIAAVVRRATGRAVCAAFVEALQRFGIPDEVLTDNGKQFTGRFTKPRPGEVMFERICRENGIVARNTKPRTPTTTGKVERFHQTLQRELLDDIAVWPDLQAARPRSRRFASSTTPTARTSPWTWPFPPTGSAHGPPTNGWRCGCRPCWPLTLPRCPHHVPRRRASRMSGRNMRCRLPLACPPTALSRSISPWSSPAWCPCRGT